DTQPRRGLNRVLRNTRVLLVHFKVDVELGVRTVLGEALHILAECASHCFCSRDSLPRHPLRNIPKAAYYRLDQPHSPLLSLCVLGSGRMAGSLGLHAATICTVFACSGVSAIVNSIVELSQN